MELILERREGGPENEVDSSFKNLQFMGHDRLDSLLGSYSGAVNEMAKSQSEAVKFGLDSECRRWYCSIDANLAHIDFDDFKNEDLQNAFAFSLPSYVSIEFFSSS